MSAPRPAAPGRFSLAWPDLAGGAVLAGACALWSALTWGRLYDPILDQGWYMQVAARVAAGEALYRDVLWMYGPLPVHLLAGLFRALGVHVGSLLLLCHGLAALGCLLTYAVARSLLSPALALLATLALALGGWWGGLVGYTFAYTGAVPLGGVLGLALALALLRSGRRGGLLWPMAAGLAAGAAALTKPEFALASLGTGGGILAAAWIMRARAGDGRPGRRAFLAYLVTAAATVALGLAPLVRQAGSAAVWEGYSAYDQGAILLREWPPWGTRESTCYIISGLGIYLLAGVGLAAAAAPRALRGRRLAAGLLAALGLALALAPWREIDQLRPGLVPAMLASRPAFIEEAIQALWSPTTLALAALLAYLGVRWLKACRRRQLLSGDELALATLALYSVLADARSFLYPIGTFHFMYLSTAAPALAFVAADWLPRALGGGDGAQARARAGRWVAAAMVAYGVAGAIWEADYIPRMDTRWAAPRGTVWYDDSSPRRKPWPELLQYIVDETLPDEPIAILGHEAGFYFWTGRSNPLRHDAILPGLRTAPGDAREIAQRLEAARPALIIVPRSVPGGRGWFWELEEGRAAYDNLAPVWRFVEARYALVATVGGDGWGYAIYKPRE